MDSNESARASRRQFIKAAGGVTAASALSKFNIAVHAQGSDLIQVALVGCGGRGSGAVVDALATSGPIKLVAMADAYEDRLKTSYAGLRATVSDKINVPEDRRFVRHFRRGILPARHELPA